MSDYPPYVDAYGSIATLLNAIKRAAVPPKFTQDFISTVLGLKSTSYRAMIPFFKRLGLIDQSNIPTEAYKRYRDEQLSGVVLAELIKGAYSDLYKAHEYAEKLEPKDLQTKLKSLLGVGDDDTVVPKVAASFKALTKLADFSQTVMSAKEKGNAKSNGDLSLEDAQPRSTTPTRSELRSSLGLSYTINLNLPATTEIDVFNAIFKSLKEHLLE
jgi:hypothetical protein